MTKLKISTFGSERSSTAAREEVDWSSLCVAHVEREEKSGPCWSPATFRGDKRLAASVEELSCLVFDLDSEMTEQLAEQLEPFSYIAHTTHTPGRWRIIVETSRPHLPAEHRTLWDYVDNLCGNVFDSQCTDVSRIYYEPAHRPGTTPVFESCAGKPLDVDGVLGFKQTTPSPLAKAVDEPFDLEAWREKVKRRVKDEEKKKILLDLLSMTWAPDAGSRNNSIHRALSLLATVIRPTPEQADVVIQAVVARMNCEPEGLERWLATSRSSYARAYQRIANEEAVSKLAQEALIKKEVAQGYDSSWKERLQKKVNEDGDTSIRPVGSNLFLILENDPAFKTMRFNVVTRQVEVAAGPLCGVSFDNVDTRLSNWLQTSEYKINIPRMECFAQVKAVVESRQYDPLREYLESLRSKWDGSERISNVLHDHCGVEAGSPDYVRGVCRKFFISAVARGLRPGSQVDTMLILQGLGGVGKTTFVRALGGEFAAETTLDIHNKDGLMAITGRWLVEQAEMSSMRKADEEAFRSFITRTTDSFRPPYGRTVEHFPRRCVFIGTSNDDAMLKDVDGARRYWPVRVGKIDVPWLTNNREQLWAEAVVAYLAGEQWWFTDEERERFAPEVDLFQQSDSAVEEIQDWFLKMAINKRPLEVTMREVMVGAFQLDPKERLLRGHNAAIGKALKTLGFVKKRRNVGGRDWFYMTPTNLLTGDLRRGLQLVTPPPAEVES